MNNTVNKELTGNEVVEIQGGDLDKVVGGITNDVHTRRMIKRMKENSLLRVLFSQFF